MAVSDRISGLLEKKATLFTCHGKRKQCGLPTTPRSQSWIFVQLGMDDVLSLTPDERSMHGLEIRRKFNPIFNE
jgi:hypothetical protein